MSDPEPLDPSALPPALRPVAEAVAAWVVPEGVSVSMRYNLDPDDEDAPEVIVTMQAGTCDGGRWEIDPFGVYDEPADIASTLDWIAKDLRKFVRLELTLRACSGVGDAELARVAEGGGVRGLLAGQEADAWIAGRPTEPGDYWVVFEGEDKPVVARAVLHSDGVYVETEFFHWSTLTHHQPIRPPALSIKMEVTSDA